MRITNHMLNESARKTGLPINNTSLLSLVNCGNNFRYDIPNKKTIAADVESKKKYEKLDKAADKLTSASDVLLQEGDKSLFAKKETDSDKAKIYDGIKNFVKEYNDSLKELKNVSGVMNDFYRDMMVEASGTVKDKMKEIGISFAKDGTASIDMDKLKASDMQSVENLFGNKSEFINKVKFISTRISNNAETNIKSYGNTYSGNGNFRSGSINSKCDFRS